MLFKIEDLQKYKVHAQDKLLGHVKEFLFDQESWEIRYMVAETDKWADREEFLFAPDAFVGVPDPKNHKIKLSVTEDEVERSPNIDLKEPLDRNKETELNKYYGWPTYWYVASTPENTDVTNIELPTEQEAHESAEHVLRSTRDVIGYNVHANDGEIGHVDDFLVDSKDWRVRYIMINTRNWLPGGRHVIVASHWLKSISFDHKKVYVDLKQDEVAKSPEYGTKDPISREYELRLQDFYGNPRFDKAKI